MILAIILVAALFVSIGSYIDKHLVNKGISRNDYFYYDTLNIRIEPELKKEVETTLNELGMNIAEAVTIFLK